MTDDVSSEVARRPEASANSLYVRRLTARQKLLRHLRTEVTRKRLASKNQSVNSIQRIMKLLKLTITSDQLKILPSNVPEEHIKNQDKEIVTFLPSEHSTNVPNVV